MSKGLRTIFVLYPLLIPALVCCIWLMILGITLHHRCPERCWCSPDGRNVDCSDKGLGYIPENMLGELEKLKLDGNNYSVLQKDMFLNKGYARMEFLYFDRCNVSFIEVGAFDHISVEIQLTLDVNNLTDIRPGIFRNLTTLRGLRMANNKIEVIRSKAFQGLESLMFISLHKNSIHYFETDAFWGLFNLQSLWLSSNKITHLQPEIFSQIPKLLFLNLNWNMITIPHRAEFLISDTVKMIVLQSCNISQLNEKTFRNMSNLETIELQNNSLTSVNPNTFSMLPNLSSVYLYDNPLVCDCNLKATLSWFVDHNIQTGIRDDVPRCNAPIQLNGLWWGVLANGECHEGVMMFYKDVKSIVHKYIPDEMDDEDTYRHFFYFEKYVQVIIDVVLFLFGTVGNVTLIIIILRHKELRTIPNLYILSLAIGDLTSLTLNGPLTYLNYSDTWELGEFLCRFFRYVRRLSIGVSCYSVVILSIQRYQVIARPILSRIRINMSRKTVALHISSVWFLASLFAIPSCISAHVDLKGRCTTLDSMIYYQKVVIFELVVECVLPLCIIAAMYILTASHLMRSQVIASEEIHQHQAKARTTTVKTILSLTLVFVISFVPYHTMLVYFTWNDEYEYEVAMVYLGYISSCLLFVNACFNPVALYYSSKSFRTHYKSFLLWCCKKQSI